MMFMLFVFLFVPTAFGTLSMPGRVQIAAELDARQLSPIGRWKTVDDATGKVTSVVLISEENGTLYGSIERLISLDPRDPNPRCTRCEGALKDKH